MIATFERNPEGYLAFANMKFELVKMGVVNAGQRAFDAMTNQLQYYGYFDELVAEYGVYNDQYSEFDE